MAAKMSALRSILVVIAVIAGIVLSVQDHARRGTRFASSASEAVNYSGTATEQDARRLAEALKEIGYFDGKGSRDVLFRKEPDGITVSFIVKQGVWDDSEAADYFELRGKQIAEAVGTVPFNLELMDHAMNVHKTLTITKSAGRSWKVSDGEIVRYCDKATEEDAKKLGEALQKAGLFTGSKNMTVVIRRDSSGTTLGFVVKDGVWDDPMFVRFLKRDVHRIADSVGGLPLTVELLDSKLDARHTETMF